MKQKKHKNESVGKNTGSFSFLHSFSVLVFRKKKKQKPKILLPATAPRGHVRPQAWRQLHGWIGDSTASELEGEDERGG
jgi:hypothetical protein